MAWKCWYFRVCEGGSPKRTRNPLPNPTSSQKKGVWKNWTCKGLQASPGVNPEVENLEAEPRGRARTEAASVGVRFQLWPLACLDFRPRLMGEDPRWGFRPVSCQCVKRCHKPLDSLGRDVAALTRRFAGRDPSTGPLFYLGFGLWDTGQKKNTKTAGQLRVLV